MTNNNKFENILISGAGLAGLALANYLQNHNIPFEIFEEESSVDARAQGWSISINFALKALHECMPEESFKDFNTKVSVNPEEGDNGTSLSFVNANSGQAIMSKQTKGGEAYLANRDHLRHWLLEPVKDKVQWNKKVQRFEEKEGKVTVFFADGSHAEGDLLVATDGINSPIASQLLGGLEKSTNLLPIKSYGALRWVSEDLWRKVAQDTPNHVSVLNGKQKEDDGLDVKTFNMFWSLHNVDRSRKDIYHILWSISRYDEHNQIPSFKNTPEDHKACLDLMKKWVCNALPEDSPYREIVMTTPDDADVYPIIIRDRYPDADKIAVRGSRVVLVGDAAHPMTMFRGQGGNHAITDSAKLGAAILKIQKGESSLEDALEAYNTEMIERGSKAVKESHDAAIVSHMDPTKMYQAKKAEGEQHQQQQEQQ